MFVKRRTAVYKNTHQKNTSALKKYIKHDLAQAKTVITISRTNTDNIQSFAKETIKISVKYNNNNNIII